MESFLWPLLIFHAIVGIVGLPGNALIILVYGKKRQLMSPHVFILALAVADLIICLFTPITIYHWYIKLNYTSDFLCRLVVSVTFITVYNSCFLTSAIAVDRYQAICRPHRRWMTVQRAKYAALLCLVLAMFCAVPVFASYHVQREGESQTGICTISTKVPSWVKYLKFSVTYVAPVSSIVTNTILYAKIYFAIRKQAAVRPGAVPSNKVVTETTPPQPNQELQGTVSYIGIQSERYIDGPCTTKHSNVIPNFKGALTHQHQNNQTDGPPPKTNRHTNDVTEVALNDPNKNHQYASAKFNGKTTKMLVITTVVYFSTWLLGISLMSIPRHTQNYILEHDEVGAAFFHTFSFVFYVNNAVNPFIYGFVNSRFRQECKETMKTVRCHST
ncbi:cholecystokinin receptor type A-like [Acanthaster planci]|uniref:Cholecystokinin receptor type A-like n=1 Tax=Acanthaster planci TaxID=133434 RepID=A0A8B8A0W8_ACAPL|nr:cholecystokinin receptor type A-like [Acanthaster planci]